MIDLEYLAWMIVEGVPKTPIGSRKPIEELYSGEPLSNIKLKPFIGPTRGKFERYRITGVNTLDGYVLLTQYELTRVFDEDGFFPSVGMQTKQVNQIRLNPDSDIAKKFAELIGKRSKHA